MALAHDAERFGRTGSVPGPQERPLSLRAGRAAVPNSISASQARAARRREALSNQQAVAAWLRELAARRP
ncbi:MAG: hypothetical protein QOE28_2494 [Solirubrobacteraceae bacterium]|jgi:hypothetical protein|nr:hypothetical protein [Solirubrobacteraceae bacterium]